MRNIAGENHFLIRRSDITGWSTIKVKRLRSEIDAQTGPRRVRRTGSWSSITNITAPTLKSFTPNPEESIRALFNRARYEAFEAGFDTDFSNELQASILKYSDQAIEIIAHLILHGIAGPEPASEALSCIGAINHSPTYNYRRWLLERCLSSGLARVRDGALIGLSFLDDPHAIPFLEEAIVREQRVGLRKDMQKLLRQLEETRECHSSSEQ